MVKASDSKSDSLWERRFESYQLRKDADFELAFIETGLKETQQNSIEGAPGFEPGTSRSAVECSTTELYPLL